MSDAGHATKPAGRLGRGARGSPGGLACACTTEEQKVLSDRKYDELVAELINAAKEKANHDSEFLTDFRGFARVMWSDDLPHERRGREQKRIRSRFVRGLSQIEAG